MPQYTIAIVHACISQMSDWLSNQSAWNTNRSLLIFTAQIIEYVLQYPKIYVTLVNLKLHNLFYTVFFTTDFTMTTMAVVEIYCTLNDLNSDIQ